MYKDCDNFSRIYYTNSITSTCSSVTIHIPNCVRSSRVCLLKINQSVPTTSTQVYVSLGNSTEAYPLVDINGVQLKSCYLKLNAILMVAKVCSGVSCCREETSKFMLVNYAIDTYGSAERTVTFNTSNDTSSDSDTKKRGCNFV